MIGRTIGHYQVLGLLGQGGMASVYLAEQVGLRRRVALKMLHPQLAKDEIVVQRFLREARIAANLHHPHIVTIYDVGETDGSYYLAMRCIDGESLSQILRREGALEPHRALAMLDQVAQALDFAHEHGVLHRDVKPANVMVEPGDVCTLTDFGIARAGEQSNLTSARTVIGTPQYMSPEQATGQKVDKRSDLYALGIMLHEMLGGRPPFVADSTPSLLYLHVHQPPPPLHEIRPELPRALSAVVARALAKQPDARFQSGRDMVAAARAALEPPAPSDWPHDEASDEGETAMFEPPAPATVAWEPPRAATPAPAAPNTPYPGQRTPYLRQSTPYPSPVAPYPAPSTSYPSQGAPYQAPATPQPAAPGYGYQPQPAANVPAYPPVTDAPRTPMPAPTPQPTPMPAAAPVYTVYQTPAGVVGLAPMVAPAPADRGGLTRNPWIVGLAMIGALLLLTVGGLVVLQQTGVLDHVLGTATPTPVAVVTAPTPDAASAVPPAATAAPAPAETPAPPTETPPTPTPAPPTATLPPPTPAPAERVAAAQRTVAAGDLPAAIQQLEAARQDAGVRADAALLATVEEALRKTRVVYGNLLLEQGQLDQSASQFQEALALAPKDADAASGLQRVTLARNYQTMEATWGKDDDAAIRALEENMLIDPGYRDTRDKLYALLIAKADRLIAAGDRAGAFPLLMQALDVSPERPEAKQRLTTYTPAPAPAPGGPPAPGYTPPGRPV